MSKKFWAASKALLIHEIPSNSSIENPTWATGLSKDYGFVDYLGKKSRKRYRFLFNYYILNNVDMYLQHVGVFSAAKIFFAAN